MIPSVVPELRTISSSDARIQEPRDRAADALVLLGREVRQEVQAAMDVRIFLGIGRGSPRRSPPAASAPRRRCRGRPAACRSPRAPGSGNRRGPCPRRTSRPSGDGADADQRQDQAEADENAHGGQQQRQHRFAEASKAVQFVHEVDEAPQAGCQAPGSRRSPASGGTSSSTRTCTARTAIATTSSHTTTASASANDPVPPSIRPVQ